MDSIAPIVESNEVKPPSPPLEVSSIPKEMIVAKALCNSISEIKFLSVENETGNDETYDALIEAGESVVPCLIEKITDTTIMPDPRGTRVSKETKVGDVAYFVLIDITKLDFTEMLPDKVKEKFKVEGVYAYHDYIERKGSRKRLQERLIKWQVRRLMV